jgi:hypothetical protein
MGARRARFTNCHQVVGAVGRESDSVEASSPGMNRALPTWCGRRGIKPTWGRKKRDGNVNHTPQRGHAAKRAQLQRSERRAEKRGTRDSVGMNRLDNCITPCGRRISRTIELVITRTAAGTREAGICFSSFEKGRRACGVCLSMVVHEGFDPPVNT